LTRWLPEIPRLLQAWKGFVGPLQPCLRDVWHDHLLFEGEALTGLVDYAAVGVDSVAADLARMLGSLIEDDEQAWGIALEAYRERRPLSLDEQRLARILDSTGVIAALGGWWRRLSGPRAEVVDGAVVARRMEVLLRRTAAWCALPARPYGR
jgi:homoserine kinase type II